MLHVYYMGATSSLGDDDKERGLGFHLQHERTNSIYAIDICADDAVAYVAVGGADKIAEILEISTSRREVRSTARFELSDQILAISLVERFNRNNGEKGLLLATGGMDKRVSVFHVSFPATKRMV
jgi:hypothetical protein